MIASFVLPAPQVPLLQGGVSLGMIIVNLILYRMLTTWGIRAFEKL